MCNTCGCESSNEIKFSKPGESHEHNYVHQHKHTHGDEDHIHEHHHHYHHAHEHGHETHEHDHTHEHHHHEHEHHHSHEREIILQKNILAKNDLTAERNRGYFEAKNILSLNIVSSPGSGKTSLLEKTITDNKNEIIFSVIEGDQQTMNDAERIYKTGANVIQINTGDGCHLDSAMINQAVKELNPADNSILFIENVGNLVCPSLFDLGESKRVVIISTPEGDDKPLKYPNMFSSSHLCIINKTDLLPYLDFNIEKAKENALKVNKNLDFIELSVKTEENLKKWYDWLQKLLKK